MEKEIGDLNTLIQEKLDADTDFQSSLADLSDEERTTATTEKRNELINAEFSSMSEKAKKAEEIAKNQKIRAEKAEAEAKKPKEVEKETISNEPDYARLAFLESKSVKHPDDQKIVLDEAARLKLPLTDILGMEHIKSKLKDLNDQREAQDGMPKGKGKAGGANQGDVDYWVAKGQAPDDPELREKYFEARIKRESEGNKFSDDLYNE